MANNTAVHASTDTVDGQGLCLLSLDGGGVRGLSSLLVLKSIMDQLNHTRRLHGSSRVKPCDVFDLIGGTSTGGLIALMLGRLKMEVDDCIESFCNLAEASFGTALDDRPTRPDDSGNKLEAKYDPAEHNRAILELLKSRGISGCTKLNASEHLSCRTLVCTMDKDAQHIVRLRDYSVIDESVLPEMTVREAAYATSATPNLFPAFQIGHRTLIDGSLKCNNPVEEVQFEAADLWSSDGDIMPLVKCLVSIGSGHPGIKPIDNENFNRTLNDLASSTEDIEARMARIWGDRKLYFRFNVSQGTQDIGPTEYKKYGPIEGATEAYLNHTERKARIRDCVRILGTKRGAAPLNLKDLVEATHHSYTLPRSNPVSRFAASIQEHIMQFKLPTFLHREGFIGRTDELKKLSKALLPDSESGTDSPRRKIFVIHGEPGVGKAHLALEFARQYQAKFSGVFWLNGNSGRELKASIASCLDQLPRSQDQQTFWEQANGRPCTQEAAVYDVYNWLTNKHNTRWIMVIFNANKEYYPRSSEFQVRGIHSYIPRSEHGSILITTVLATLKSLGGHGGSITLTREEVPTDEAVADVLLTQRLQGAPIAITQATAYIQVSELNPESYLKILNAEEQALEQRIGAQNMPSRDSSDRSVWITSTLAFKAVRKQNHYAANLLILWSFLSPQDLWYGLFTGARESHQLSAMLREWLGDLANSERAFDEAVRLLQRYALINENNAGVGPGHYSMRQVVHEWMYRYNKRKDQGQLMVLSILTLWYALPHRKITQSAESQMIQIHASACWSRLQGQGPSAHDWARTIKDPDRQAFVSDIWTKALLGLLRPKDERYMS